MKKSLTPLNILILLNSIFLITLLDFLSKRWISNNFPLFEVTHITSTLNIVHTHNYGLAFSLFSNVSKEHKYILYFINFITIIIISKIMCFISSNKTYYNFIYILIIGGAIGNLIDRLRFGFVIDFIDIHFKNWHFAIFNIADISIFLGSILLIYIHLYKNK